MSYKRPCNCPHKFPVCACSEGVSGPDLLRRSRTLSSLAGWPAPLLDPAEVARIVARHGRPRPEAKPDLPDRDCGCGKAKAR